MEKTIGLDYGFWLLLNEGQAIQEIGKNQDLSHNGRLTWIGLGLILSLLGWAQASSWKYFANQAHAATVSTSIASEPP